MASKSGNTTAEQSALQYHDGIATIDGKPYRCHTFKALSVVNELPVIQMVLTPEPEQAGKNSKRKLPHRYKVMYKQLMEAQAGAELTVVYKFTGGAKDNQSAGEPEGKSGEPVILFKGILTGWAPVWVGKVMQFTVWASSGLSMLSWASSRLDAIHGLGMNDTQLPTIISKDEELVPFLRGKYKDSVVSEDLWKELIKPELISLSKMKRAGIENMARLVEVLEDDELDQSPLPLTLATDDPLSVLLHVRKTLMTSRLGQGTLWEQFKKLLVQYKLSIIFRLTDYMVVPLMRTLSGRPKVKFSFGDFVTINRFNAVVSTLTESADVITGPGASTGFFDTVNKAQVGLSVQVSAERRGHYVADLPPWLDRSWTPLQYTSKTLGLKSDKLQASGYMTTEPEADEDEETVNTLYNDGSESKALIAYTEATLSDLAYRGVGVIKGGVTFDIAPGSMVQTELPDYRYPYEPDYKSFFGVAWAVCVILDGTPKTGTWVTLRNVRTEDAQAEITFKEHPMYNQRFVRTPFNPIPDITNDTEVGS